MKPHLSNILHSWRVWLFASGVLVFVLIGFYLNHTHHPVAEGAQSALQTPENPGGMTAEQAEAIRHIGKWEFLALAMEEMVDTVRPRFLFTDHRLVRLYQGTISLGVDMSRLRDHWITLHGDTAWVVLPRIESLNSDFIDPSQAKTFVETGSWDKQAYEALYQRAKAQMLIHMREGDAKRQAQENGRMQVTALLHTLGYKFVEVDYEQ